MSYDYLYKRQPCTAWPAAQLRAVGVAYRHAASQGLDGLACLDRAVAAYVAAGGERSGSTQCVLDMIASLSMQEGDRLWGPAQVLRDRQTGTEQQPNLFKPRADRGFRC